MSQPSAQTSDERTRERILDAALAHLERYGLRRTTVEDVAREAGLSRVTIHRHFGTKETLIREVVLREGRRFLDALGAAIAEHDDPAEALGDGFAFALEHLGGHPLFNRLLEAEADLLLPYLSGEGGSLLALARGWVADRLGARVQSGALPPIDAEGAAEVLVRLALSFLLTPQTCLPLGTRAETRAWARRALVPGLLGGAMTGKELSRR
jgi:AcrR family transcriptional regulator